MPLHLVVDTNVLVHASNDDYAKQDHCIDLLQYLMTSQDLVHVDDNELSFILFEYNKHLEIGMLGHTLLLQLQEDQRLLFTTRKVAPHINKKINMTGIKSADRIFVKVAFNTENKVLVTQEYEDFTKPKRKYFRKEVGVKVIEANACLSCLTEN